MNLSMFNLYTKWFEKVKPTIWGLKDDFIQGNPEHLSIRR